MLLLNGRGFLFRRVIIQAWSLNISQNGRTCRWSRRSKPLHLLKNPSSSRSRNFCLPCS